MDLVLTHVRLSNCGLDKIGTIGIWLIKSCTLLGLKLKLGKIKMGIDG
jgi:hypothetical protein